MLATFLQSFSDMNHVRLLQLYHILWKLW